MNQDIENEVEERLLSRIHVIYILISMAGILVGIGLYAGTLHAKLATQDVRINFLEEYQAKSEPSRIDAIKILAQQKDAIENLSEQLVQFREEYREDKIQLENNLKELYQDYN